jgi:DNA adenine methylase
VNARPFLKWAGGKTSLLPELLKRIPASYGTYHEPFLGGGALFFALQPQRAFLSDTNVLLIKTYLGVRNHVDALVLALQKCKVRHDLEREHFYYHARSFDAYSADPLNTAAWFIYVNKTGFNGLWRVNKSGGFNVPFGRYTNPTICDEANLRACSAVLGPYVSLFDDDFRDASKNISTGDFVYFDCPYVPLSATSNFTAYTAAGFGPKDQLDLRDLALTLKRRGVHVMLSNAGSDVVEKLYTKDFKIEEVKCRRNINSKAGGRGEITEYIIT